MDGSIDNSSMKMLEDVSEALEVFQRRLVCDSSLKDVWAYEAPMKPGISKAEHDTGCKSLRNLKILLKAIDPLHKRLDEKICQLSAGVLLTSRHHGFISLPNELFTHILNILGATCIDYAQRMTLIKRLSSVSKRFRDGVINTTSFWTNWDTKYCLDDGFEHRLARTKEAHLFLDIDVSCVDTWRKITTKVMPHQNRCHRLTLNASHDLQETIFADFMFPNVTSLKFIGVVAPPGTFSKVTSLTLCNKPGRSLYVGEYLPKLTSLLYSMSALEALDLDVSLVRLPMAEPFTTSVELPSVTRFKIGNTNAISVLTDDDDGFAPLESIGQVVRVLRLPNVQTFTLGLCLQGPRDEKAWVSTIFPEGVSFHAVDYFHLTVMSTIDEHFTLMFNGFSSRFPNLGSLRVDMCGHDGLGWFYVADPFDKLEGCLPHLHSLAVVDLDNQPCEFIDWFKSLREKGAMINRLTITTPFGNVLPGLKDLKEALPWENVDIEYLPPWFVQ